MNQEIVNLLHSTDFSEKMAGILKKEDFEKFKKELNQNILKWAVLFKHLSVVRRVFTWQDLADKEDIRLLEIEVRHNIRSFLTEGDDHMCFCLTDGLYVEPIYPDVKIMIHPDLSEGHSDSLFEQWREKTFPDRGTRMELEEFFNHLCELEKIYKESVPEAKD